LSIEAKRPDDAFGPFIEPMRRPRDRVAPSKEFLVGVIGVTSPQAVEITRIESTATQQSLAEQYIFAGQWMAHGPGLLKTASQGR
jgi:hypothetical protein